MYLDCLIVYTYFYIVFLHLGHSTPHIPQHYNPRSSPDTSSSFDFYPQHLIGGTNNNNFAVSENNLSQQQSSNSTLPNKSDSGVEGATSSLDTPLPPLVPTMDKEGNYSNISSSNNVIFTNNSQTNSLSNTIISASPKNNANVKSPRGKNYSNSHNNRGNVNRRGSFNRRWRGPGYSSDYHPSPIAENNSSPGRGSEYHPRNKQTTKVTSYAYFVYNNCKWYQKHIWIYS